jgi:4-amino-4-deoxy-L-arabinose transferase-like glycosyltransferase
MNLVAPWCAIYLISLLIVGYSTAAILLSSRVFLEKLSWAGVLGPAVAALSMIAISMAGHAPSRSEILLLPALFAAAAILVKWIFPSPLRAPEEPRDDSTPIWWTLLCCAAIAYGISSVASDALRIPVIEWDAYSNWQLKAKVLALHPMTPRPDFFSNISLSFTHLRYPLLVPMLGAGMHAATGRLDDGLEKIPHLLIYLGLGATTFFAIKQWRGQTLALGATALLMTAPITLQYAASAMADMPLAAFYGCSLIALLRWIENGTWRNLVLASLLGGCMAWTKNEGLALAIVNAAVIIAMKPRPLKLRHLALGALSALGNAVIYLPWILWQRGLPNTDEDYTHHLTAAAIAQNLPRLREITAGFAAAAIDWHHWGLFWFLLPATTLLGWRKLSTRPVVTLWLLLILHVLAYVPPLMVTGWDLALLLSVTAQRLLMHATPAAVLLIALQCPNLFKLPAPKIPRPQLAYDPP